MPLKAILTALLPLILTFMVHALETSPSSQPASLSDAQLPHDPAVSTRAEWESHSPLDRFPMVVPTIFGAFKLWSRVLNSLNAREIFEAVNSVEWSGGPFADRRLRILVQLWNGRTVPEIAQELGIQTGVVRSHLDKIHRILPAAHNAVRQEFIEHGLSVETFPTFEELERNIPAWRSFSHATKLHWEDPHLLVAANQSGYPVKVTSMGGGEFTGRLIYLLCTQAQLAEAARAVNSTRIEIPAQESAASPVDGGTSEK